MRITPDNLLIVECHVNYPCSIHIHKTVLHFKETQLDIDCDNCANIWHIWTSLAWNHDHLQSSWEAAVSWFRHRTHCWDLSLFSSPNQSWCTYFFFQTSAVSDWSKWHEFGVIESFSYNRIHEVGKGLIRTAVHQSSSWMWSSYEIEFTWEDARSTTCWMTLVKPCAATLSEV